MTISFKPEITKIAPHTHKKKKGKRSNGGVCRAEAGKEGKRQAHRHPELNIGKSHY